MIHQKTLIAVVGCLVAATSIGQAADQSLAGLMQVEDLAPSASGLGHGSDVAVSGDLAVVGRPGDGVVDVYRRAETEPTLDGLPWQWSLYGSLTLPGLAPDAGFGASVAIDGQTVVVGAWKDDTVGTNAGGAWAFDVPADSQGWSEGGPAWYTINPGQPGVPSSELAESDYFGWDVAVSGDIVAVGAWGDDTAGDHAGAVHVFQRTEGGYTHVTKVTPGESEGGSRFGSTVAMAGELLLVGAPARAGWSGATYVFDASSGGWPLVQRLDSPEGDAWERFGHSIATITEEDGDVTGILVGAPGDGELGQQAGCVYVFTPVEGGESLLYEPFETPKLVAPGGGPLERAGASVSVLAPDHSSESDDGGGVLIGAPGWRHPEDGQEHGAIYFVSFDEVGGGTEESGRVVLPSEPGGGLGACMACDVGPVGGESGFNAITILGGLPGANAGYGRVHLIHGPAVPHGGDCDEDGTFDPMEVYFYPESADCDGDGSHDACQLHDGAEDCNGDTILDVCQLDLATDCDGNGVLDECEVGGPGDCNADGVPDVCQLGGSSDCNGDGVLDDCQLSPATDCDGNGALDECEVGGSGDCNVDGVPDVCQLDGSSDCNGDAVLDECQLGPQTDCDGDGVLDDCQLNQTTDCDGNSVLDV